MNNLNYLVEYGLEAKFGITLFYVPIIYAYTVCFKTTLGYHFVVSLCSTQYTWECVKL